MPQESIGDGASLAFFSGDKLLGGPQAGIIVGKSDLINVVSKHPLARAVRIDKGSLAALNATLLHYLKDEATSKIPIWEMISRSAEFLAQRAESWRLALNGPTSVVPGESTVGGGSLPGETLPTSLLSIDASEIPGGANALAANLRRSTPPIIGRIDAERVMLDPRTVPQDLDDVMVRGIFHAL